MGAERQERNHYAHQCGGNSMRRKQDVYRKKYCYDNLLEALYACRRMDQLNPGYRFTVYECGLCGFIHVGRVHPNAILYMGDMSLPVIPALPVLKKIAPCRNPSKREKRAIVRTLIKQWKADVVAGLDKPLKTEPWRRAVEQSTHYRGYRPFEALRELQPEGHIGD